MNLVGAHRISYNMNLNPYGKEHFSLLAASDYDFGP